MRILYLISCLGPSGAGRQLEILARHQQRDGYQVEVCQFQQDSAAALHLERQGIRVHSLPWKRRFDPVPLWKMHALLRDFQPELIHAWDTSSLRVLAVVGRKLLGKVVLSRPFSWRQRISISRLDRWLVSKVARVVVQNEVEARLAAELGLFLDKIAVIPPAAEDFSDASEAAGIPRKIVCVGPFERHKGHRDAVWAFDVLRHLFDDAHLLLVGDGSDRPALEKMVRDARCDHLASFAPPTVNVAQCLTQADVCWVPSRRGGGSSTALEAMLAARPVVACRVPSLDGLIIDGESGFFVPPGDKIAMARLTRRLFLDPPWARRIGEQARARALSHFAPPLFVERYRRIYEDCADCSE